MHRIASGLSITDQTMTNGNTTTTTILGRVFGVCILAIIVNGDDG